MHIDARNVVRDIPPLTVLYESSGSNMLPNLKYLRTESFSFHLRIDKYFAFSSIASFFDSGATCVGENFQSVD